MRLLLEGSKSVRRLLGEQRSSGKVTGLYPSRYALSYRTPDGKRCLWNELTRSLLLLETPEELAFFDYFESLQAETEAPRNRLPEDLAVCEGGRELFRRYFLLEEEADALKLYRDTLGTLRLLAPKGGGKREYMILTTTHCNARCAYCYESKNDPRAMSPETARALAEYIIRTRDPGRETKLVWFGGEPLMGKEVIQIVSDRLNRESIPFYALIVSNGYLFDEDTVRHAASDWHVRSVQITLDGTEEKYNRIKNYIAPEGSPFQKVIRNMHGLINAGVPVNVRINGVPGDLEDARALARQMKEEFKDAPLSNVYVNNLFMTGDEQLPYGLPPASARKYLEEVDALQLKLQELGMQKDGWQRERDSQPLQDITLSLCRAASVETSAVIDPLGRLTNCQHCLPGAFYGDVWNGTSDAGKAEQLCHPPLKPACRECPFLPSCSELNAYCPDLIKWCGWSKRRALQKALDQWWERASEGDES